MSATRCRDICGGVEIDELELDEDGSRVCSACRRGLVPAPVGDWENATLSNELRIWVGKNKWQS